MPKGLRVRLPSQAYFSIDACKIFIYDYDEMKGGAVTVQFPQVDTIEPRLLPDSYTQKSSDNSFEEKLKFEQARLGFLFSPFSQLESLFFSQPGTYLGMQSLEQEVSRLSANEKPNYEPPRQNYNFSSTQQTNHPTTQIFESIPLQSFNRQVLQQLLSQTNWLVPNLATQSLFSEAFLEGKLQLKFDLQFLVDQIIEQVKMVKGKEKTELSLMLKPEELGKILLTLTSHSGVVSIQIQASPETKKLIDSQREELERALKKAKVNFDKIQIQEVEKYA